MHSSMNWFSLDLVQYILATARSTATPCHLQRGFNENIINAGNIIALKSLSDNSDYPAELKSELRDTGKGVNLKPGETQLVVQLDKSRPVLLSAVTLFVPQNQQDQIEKVQVLVRDSADKKKKATSIVSLQGKEMVARFANLLQNVSATSATEIELRMSKKVSGNANVRLEIKACFHTTTSSRTPQITSAPVFKSKRLFVHHKSF